jgi:predicted hydrocarbon binding protein
LNETETLEAGLVLAGLDALRQIEGGPAVRAILEQAVGADLLEEEAGSRRVPILDYLRYRDAALKYLGASFDAVAFETGRTLVRNLRHRRMGEVQALLEQFKGAANRLPAIGQAAVLAARGNPGVVRALPQGDSTLLIAIEKCPECRDVQRDRPFCFLNQGIITEFAARYLQVAVATRETACMALGAPRCEIVVSLASGS